MNGNRKGSKRRKATIHPYTFTQAQRVLPYLRSIVQSLRDHHLEARARQREARLLLSRPGRPNRDTLVALAEAQQAARAAEDRFQHSLDELHTLDIYCLDPVRGEAIIPFVHDNQLAWFIF